MAWLLFCMALAGCAMAPARQETLKPSKAPISPASSPEVLAAGARLYHQHCVHCHGGEGTGSLAAPLDQHGHAWHHPDSVLMQTIIEGTTRSDLSMPDLAMPPFGAILTAEDIQLLIACAKASWTPEQQQLQWERTERADLHQH
jgi:mono/diheme cytochrome c family protein